MMLQQLHSTSGSLTGVGQRHARSCIGLRASRPVRHRRLAVSAFKDWFSGLVQQPKEPQQPTEPQKSSHITVQEPVAAVPQPQQPLSKSAPKRDFLEARQVSLFQLFDSSEYKFDIPTYQRPYAWRTKQIYELLQDFVKAYESRQEYFLGAIVATRASDGANAPYQLIDGQQRLTSLVLLLAFLHGWARQQGNEVLEGRIRRMLYLDAEPLDSASSGRYRLRLRDADDEFFRNNVLDAFLPHQYRLAGLAAAVQVEGEAGTGKGGEAAALAVGGDAVATSGGRPLENETWWRLYENASFLRAQLDQLVEAGLNLQDFAFHVLRNCFVVLMVARDEGASFRIFSTLNGRGMDLSVVDKLKADLLAGELTPAERTHFAGAWAEMESVLGRAAFHRVFDYMRELAAVRDPRVRETSVLEYFTRRVDDPAAVKQVLQVALDYARLLLQLRQASWAAPELAALLAETPTAAVQPPQEGGIGGTAVAAAVHAVWEQAAAAAVLAPEEEGLLLEKLHEQHRQWQDGSAASAAAVATELPMAVEVEAVEAPPPSALGVAEGTVSTSTVEAAAANEGDGVLVFRFDDLPAPAVDTGASAAASFATAFATAATDVDTIGSESVLTDVSGVAGEVSGLEVSVAAVLAVAAEAEAPQEVVAEVPSDGPLTAVARSAAEQHAAVSVAAAAVELQPAAHVAPAAVVAVEQPSEPVSAAAALGELLREQQHLETRVDPLLLMQGPEQAQRMVEVSGGVASAADAVVSAEAVAAEAVAEAAASEPVAEDPAEAERRRQAALLADLDVRSRHLNMFTDEAWLPPLLEFFYQTEDLEARASFMKGAEALQLLLELLGDPAAKAARWGAVSEALLQRPFRPEVVLAALRLTDDERQLFRARLDSKDLYGTADQRTLRHLLIRCEPPVASRLLASSGLGGLIVDRLVPQTAPEGSLWRKTRISSPCDPHSDWPDLWFATAAASGEPASSSPHDMQPQAHADEAAPSSVSSPMSYDVKYWYEVQRLNWHGKLGNLVLLPATAAGAVAATADFDVKAALWRQAGVAARLPGFTAPLVNERGRYGRFRFCHDECRQRHADMLEFLVSEFEL